MTREEVGVVRHLLAAFHYLDWLALAVLDATLLAKSLVCSDSWTGVGAEAPIRLSRARVRGQPLNECRQVSRRSDHSIGCLPSDAGGQCGNAVLGRFPRRELAQKLLDCRLRQARAARPPLGACRRPWPGSKGSTRQPRSRGRVPSNPSCA